MKERILFICNPISGSSIERYFRKTKSMNEKFIDKYLDTDKYEYEVLFTE